MDELQASSACPLCGQDTPHAHHTAAIIAWLHAQLATFTHGVEFVIRTKVEDDRRFAELRSLVQSLEDDIREAGYRQQEENWPKDASGVGDKT